MPVHLFAHGDRDALAAERRAAWTGRCEVWRHGSPAGGPFTEWDFTAAYANVGVDTAVPVKLAGTSGPISVEQWRRLGRRYAVLTEIDVETDVPVLPTLVEGRIVWPVGRFSTTAWNNELALVDAGHHRVTVTRSWWYRRAPALAPFCEWVLSKFSGGADAGDPVVALAAKHWSRALVGRFGARWSDWSPVGVAPSSGLELGRVIDRGAGESYDLLQVGHRLFRKMPERDSPDALPSIMSYVMAECRVRLWRAIETAGADNVVYMDTDGLIVTEAGSERLRGAQIPGLRPKGAWGSVELLAPRQIRLSGRLKAAGVPARASQVGPFTYEAEVWQGLPESLRRGTPAAVEVAVRRIRLSGTDHRREHLEAGRTAPRRVTA